MGRFIYLESVVAVLVMPSYYYPFVGGSCQEEIEDGCIILVMSSNEFDFFVQTLLHTLAVLHFL